MIGHLNDRKQLTQRNVRKVMFGMPSEAAPWGHFVSLQDRPKGNLHASAMHSLKWEQCIFAINER
jgi:hypothetical protein